MDLSNPLVGVLTDHKRRVAEEALKAGRPMPEVVFPSTTGGPMDADNLREDFARILKRAGMRKVRFHDIRHTYDSILPQRNENITDVSRQMGHSSMKVTIDTYGHLIPGGNRDAIDRLDDHEWREGIGNRPATDAVPVEMMGLPLVG